jgi:hypothetical protein
VGNGDGNGDGNGGHQQYEQPGQRGHCVVCELPQSHRIDQEMLAGASDRELAAKYGPSRMAFWRHRQAHLSPALVRLAGEVSAREHGTKLERLETMYAAAAVMLSALREGKGALVLQAVREARSTVLDMHRLERDGAPGRDVNVYETPALHSLATRVGAALADHPKARELAVQAMLARPAGNSANEAHAPDDQGPAS